MKPITTLITLLFLASLSLNAQSTKQDSLNNALFEAVKANNLEQVNQLVEKGEDVNAKYAYNNFSPLHNACQNENGLKTDKLNIRPIFHINEAQTRGHVFVCMFSYAIVKELETAIYPWLKTYNKKIIANYRTMTLPMN